jgi:mono/diheme cytochrome c family protein
MMRIHIVMLLSGIVGLGSASANDLDEDVGKQLFGEYCAGCHGADKSGLPDYGGTLAAFTARMEGVTENMPDFAGFFDEDEIAALYTYLITPAE